MATTENSNSRKRHRHSVWSNNWEQNSVNFFVLSQQPCKVGVISLSLGKETLKLKEAARRDVPDGICVIKAMLGVPRKAEPVERTHRYTTGKEPASGINSWEKEGLEDPNRPSARWKPWNEGTVAQYRCKSLLTMGLRPEQWWLEGLEFWRLKAKECPKSMKEKTQYIAFWFCSIQHPS